MEQWGVGDATHTSTNRYLEMEHELSSIDAWAWRMKRQCVRYFAHAPRSMRQPRRHKGCVHYNWLFFTS
jgi:hypothetical protein